MATGSPVSFWYGTRAQFDSITTKLDTVLYFITDEQALYKGSVKFSGSGVDTLLTISATEPTASSVTTGDKYFNTSDNLIHVLKNENGTVTTTATYEPANGALYYNANAQRFQTLIKNGSSYTPTEIYDAGISVEDDTGLILNGTTVSGLDATTNSKGVVQVGSNLNVSEGVISVPTATNAVFGVVKSGDNITNTNGVLSVGKATTSALGVVKVGDNINVDNNGKISVPVAEGSTKGVVQLASSIGSSETNVVTEALVREELDDLQDEINSKQDELFPGAGIALNGSVISATGAVSMTTTERMALTPAPGFLIWDTYLEKLFVGDGSTVGGKEIEGGGGGGGGGGTVTGIKASVSGNTATIIATGSTTSVKLTGTGGVDVKGNTTTGAVELDAKDLSDGTQSVTKDTLNARMVDPTFGVIPTEKCLTLLHFSDIHADTAALARIVADGTALGTKIDGMICTGDFVHDQTDAAGFASWWDADVMTCIGNHDSADYTVRPINWNAMSMADRDTYYIAPFESNWGVTHTSGTSYYYKDYTTEKLRLIVLDVVLYITPTSSDALGQTAWLESLLADAITNNLHVLIACHAPKLNAAAVHCSFSAYGATVMPDIAETAVPQSIVDLVGTKIEAGLHFAGYICGHWHQDAIWDATGDGTQYMYGVCTANVADPQQWATDSDLYRNTELDAFNLVTVDTKNSLVKIVRAGGANIDLRLRPRETICIDYANHVIIDREIVRTDRFVPVEEITGATATLRAGHAYSATVTDSLTLTSELFSGAGADAHAVIALGSTASIIAGTGVQFTQTLSAGSSYLCSIKFFNGTAYVTVDTMFGGYTVTLATGTESGSLYYGLTVDSAEMVLFDSTLDTIEVTFGGASVSAAKNLVGNGAENTILGGTIYPGDDLISMTDLSLADTYVSGGTLFIRDGVVIQAGSTVTGAYNPATPGGIADPYTPVVLDGGTVNGTLVVSGGSHSAIRGGTLNGTVICALPIYPFADGAVLSGTGTIDGGGTGYVGTNTGVISVSGITIRNALNNVGTGHCAGFQVAGGTANLTGCLIEGNTSSGTYGYGCIGVRGGSGAMLNLTNCIVKSNRSKVGGIAIINVSATINLTGCTIADNYAEDIDSVRAAAIFNRSANGVMNLTNCLITGNTGANNSSTTGFSSGTLTITGCTFGQKQDLTNYSGTIHISGTVYSASRITFSSAGTVILEDGAQFVMQQGVFTQPSVIYAKKLIIGTGCSTVLIDGTTVALAGGTYSCEGETGGYYISKTDGTINQG